MAFWLFLVTVGTFGAAYNEGIPQQIEAEGVKATYERVVESKVALDYSKLNK